MQLQFDVLLTAGRDLADHHDFALAAVLGRLGLGVFEACGADVADPGDEPGRPVWEES